MFNISVPIDDYIDKTFFIKKEKMIILPRKKDDERKTINLNFSLEDSNILNNLNKDILNALTDGFINGYIESHKDITKELLKLDYDYLDIGEITGLNQNSILKIKDEL